MEQGWVKLHRQIGDNLFLMHDNNAYMVFTKLLMIVNKKNGQYATGRNALAEYMNINSRTLYGVLIRLEKEGMLNIQANNKYSVFTICNWEKYQSSPTTTSTTTQQPRNNHATTTQHLNKKEEGRIKNISTNVDTETFGNSEINDLFAYWEEMTGNKITANVTKNRYACKNLLKKHGAENLKRMIGGVAYSHGEKYAPSIASFMQLQAKWDDLVVWGKKHKTVKKGGTYKI